MGSSISQPNPLDNDHHKATAATTTTTTTNHNDDYQVGDPVLANMIGQDLIYMKEAMVKVQKYVDHVNVQINQACGKFEELKTRGESDTKELGELKKAVKKLKSQIPSKLIKTQYDDDSKPRRNPWSDGSINSSSNNYQVLEIECFPEMVPPIWLLSSNLKNLKKLYIRGGLLCYLGLIGATTVEMLQLKYVSNLEIAWMDLRILFPNLIYLEKVECPRLTRFPCDRNGV